MNGVAHLFTLLVLTFGFVVTGCDQSEREPAADWVFEGGKVFTAEPDAPWAEAVAVKGGQIVYVGSSDGVQDLIGAETQVVDVGAGLLIPGHGQNEEATGLFNVGSGEANTWITLANA
ncbi:MAG: hypothetical protein ACO3TX_08085, partial [Pseudomonadales bacterium]